MSSGLTAAGLLVLLLALIGLGVGLYYAYICLQARPLRPKQPKDSERGLLIPPDPDVNGNHEDVPLEASAPLHEEVDANHKLYPDQPDKDVSAPNSPASCSPQPPVDKEDVLISVEDDIPPARVIHEKEIVPVQNHVAPLGFVVPPVAVPQETPLDHHPVPKRLQLQPQDGPEIESPPSGSAPAPVYVPPPHAKKPVAISDEEDGLLLQKPPQDDSLDPEHCPDHTLPLSEPPPKSNSGDEPVASRSQPPETMLQNNTTTDPPKPVEDTLKMPPKQPSTAVPKNIGASEPEAQPVAVIVPHPDCSKKEDLKPVGKESDTVPPEVCTKPTVTYVKEDDEQLSHLSPTKVPNNEKPSDILEDEAPVVNSVPPNIVSKETKDPTNKENNLELEGNALPPSYSSEDVELMPKPSSEINKMAILEDPIEMEREMVPPGDAEVLKEEQRSNSSCSVSSEEPVPPYPVLVTPDVKPSPISELAAPTDNREPLPADCREAVSHDVSTSAEIDQPAKIISNVTEAATKQDPAEEPSLITPAKDHTSNVPMNSSDISPEALSDTSSDASDTHCEDSNNPAEATEPVNPSQPAALEIPLDTSNIPLEAYSVDSEDDFEGTSSPLPVIKEEGSADYNSENTDTESSEPEVTEYSFSSGPSAPSTTGVLADEVSCALEPKITKIVIMDASESEDAESSDSDSLEEEDSASLPEESADSNVKPSLVIENEANKVKTEPTPTCGLNSSSSSPDPGKENSAPDLVTSGGLTSTEPVLIEMPITTPDSTSTLSKEAESSSSGSDTDSEGAEAEPEFREEVVTVPAIVCENSKKHNANSSPLPPGPPNSLTSHTGNTGCILSSQLPNTPEGTRNSLKDVTNSVADDEDDGSSLSASESSSSCDLSDGEVTTSTPKKSMIPRLVKHSEA